MIPIPRLYTEIFCDLYGTILDIHTDEDDPLLWDKMCAYMRAQGAICESGAQLFAKYQQDMDVAQKSGEALRGKYVEIDVVPVWKKLYKQFSVDADDTMAYATARHFHQESTSVLRPYPHAKEFLHVLQYDLNIRPILVSNAQAAYTVADLREHGLDELFNRIFLSSDFGVKKPDKRFFDYALEQCNVERSHVVYIGNEIGCDIEGATHAGIDAIYLHTPLSVKTDPSQSELAVLNVEGANYDAVLSWFTGRETHIQGEGVDAHIAFA
ncbi:HAD family hydrolase [Alloscardovia venturai]|uniref:HAD family hydrolase n=1 Tax=Alloscardovia venturai TaxID=1769421 RepID=A0ABW2Y7S8_9BIFI